MSLVVTACWLLKNHVKCLVRTLHIFPLPSELSLWRVDGGERVLLLVCERDDQMGPSHSTDWNIGPEHPSWEERETTSLFRGWLRAEISMRSLQAPWLTISVPIWGQDRWFASVPGAVATAATFWASAFGAELRVGEMLVGQMPGAWAPYSHRCAISPRPQNPGRVVHGARSDFV